MTSMTRWVSPLRDRPVDYPEELPFLSDRGCLLSSSGSGESGLYSVIWPASLMWPADFLRQPHQSEELPNPMSGVLAFQGPSIDPRPDLAVLRWLWAGRDRLPDDVSAAFALVRESSREAGWSELRGGGDRTAWLEKGPRLRVVMATAAGVTLQEGLPEREVAAG